MTEIVDIVGETAGQVESIATASEEQSAASEEINQAITDVTQIAAETAQGMTEAAQALEAMAAMTGDLDRVIRDMTDDSVTPAVIETKSAATAPGVHSRIKSETGRHIDTEAKNIRQIRSEGRQPQGRHAVVRRFVREHPRNR